MLPHDTYHLGQANLPYILWVAAFNTSFIFGYFLLDLFFFPSPLSKSIYSPTSKLKVPKERRKFPAESQIPPAKDAPVLLDAINQNGLAVFLLVSGFIIRVGRN
jgi:phosphatidylinositol glycan class W